MKFGVFYNPMVLKAPGATDWEPGLEKQKFAEMLEQIEFADSLGFEYAFLGEHHFSPEYAHNSAPEVILGALARSTKNIRLGTGITHASHNDPVRTAERMATVDVISDGRLEWGFGPGSASEVAPFLGDGGASKGPRAMTNAQITIDIMRARGVYPGASTEFYDISPVNVVPKVVQTPHPPLWMSTIMVPQSAEVARRGLGNMILAASGPEEVGRAIELYWDTLLGGDLEIMGAGVNPAVFTFAAGIVAPTDELAAQRAEEGLAIFGFGLTGAAMLGQKDPNANMIDWYNQFRSGGVDVREQMGFPAGVLAMGAGYAHAPGNLLNSPESTRIKLRQLEAVHTDGVLLNQQFGNTKHEHIMESLELFAKEVAPEFREREAEHQEWRAKKLAGAPFTQVTSLSPAPRPSASAASASAVSTPSAPTSDSDGDLPETSPLEDSTLGKDALTIGDSINGVPVHSRHPVGPRRGVIVLLHPAPGLVPPFLGWLDLLAAEGYEAIAPALHHRAGREVFDPFADFGGDPVAFADALPSDAQMQEDIDAVLAGLAEQGVTPAEIGLLGFSYGARATFLLANTKSLGAAVSWYPVGVQRKSFGTNPDLGPIHISTAGTTPWLGLSGELDFLLQPGELDEWEVALDALGSDHHTLVRYPTAGHGFDTHGSMIPGGPDIHDGPSREDGVARTLALFSTLTA